MPGPPPATLLDTLRRAADRRPRATGSRRPRTWRAVGRRRLPVPTSSPRASRRRGCRQIEPRPGGPLRATFLTWMAERLQTPRLADVVLACRSSALSACVRSGGAERDDLSNTRVSGRCDYSTACHAAARERPGVAGRGLAGAGRSHRARRHARARPRCRPRGARRGAGATGEARLRSAGPAKVSALRTLLSRASPSGAEVLFQRGRRTSPFGTPHRSSSDRPQEAREEEQTIVETGLYDDPSLATADRRLARKNRRTPNPPKGGRNAGTALVENPHASFHIDAARADPERP